MVRLCTINVNQKNPKSIINRRLTRDTPISTILNRGTDQIQIKRNSELCLFSKSPLSPLANIEQITNTVNYQFIDMFPIFPTIDLRDEHVYDATENTVGWRHGVANAPALHTFFHVNDDQLSDEDNVSKLMVFAFGAAVAQAKTMMLNGVGCRFRKNGLYSFFKISKILNLDIFFNFNRFPPATRQWYPKKLGF